MLHDDHVHASLNLQSVYVAPAAAASDVDDSDCIHYYDQVYHLMKPLSVSEEHPETKFEESSWRRINCLDERSDTRRRKGGDTLWPMKQRKQNLTHMKTVLNP